MQVAGAEALHAAGTTAFRHGDYAAAQQLFAAARDCKAADDPWAMTVLSDYGAACAALQNHAAARDAHAAALAGRRRMLGDAHPDVGASLHNLGAALRQLGDTEAAETCHQDALRIWQAALGPNHALVAKALAALGALARDRSDTAASLHFARRVLDIRVACLPEGDPQIGLALNELGKAQSDSGDDGAALASWEAALALLRPLYGEGRALAPLLNNCGVAARAMKDFAAAKTWFGRAVAADPDLAAARHNLASVLARLGETATAKEVREAALRQDCLFVQRVAYPKATVLIPSLADAGNVPLEHILPERAFSRLWWFIANAPEPLGDALPPFDVVFNGIGDPDMDGSALDRLRMFTSVQRGMPVLNGPDQVDRTRRDRLAATLAGIGGVVVPRTCRVAGSLAPAEIVQTAGSAGIDPPALLRPAGAHGGAGVALLDSWDDLDARALRRADTWYVTRYHPCRGEDGFYRKYRVIFVDRMPYPYHLAISPAWLVHYFSSDMADYDWKLAEEAGFLADPRTALGDRAWTALEAIAWRLDLDFCGIDFTLLPDGQLLVFEANATMLVHTESQTGSFAFKAPYVNRILEATAQLVQR
jgi:tetratricopeptide (TPR) repeat protein/glutathione synthase/RimK-type ligase-like ATP-grasp enzyme